MFHPVLDHEALSDSESRYFEAKLSRVLIESGLELTEEFSPAAEAMLLANDGSIPVERSEDHDTTGNQEWMRQWNEARDRQQDEGEQQ